MNKDKLYIFTNHAINKHHLSYGEIAKLVKCNRSYIHKVHHSKPVKLKEKKLCEKCEEMLKELTSK